MKRAHTSPQSLPKIQIFNLDFSTPISSGHAPNYVVAVHSVSGIAHPSIKYVQAGRLPVQTTVSESKTYSSISNTVSVSAVKSPLSSPKVLSISQKLQSTPKTESLTDLVTKTHEIANRLKRRKFGYVSVLMKKETEHMQNFDWNSISAEFKTKFPEIYTLLLAMMGYEGPGLIKSELKIKLAMVYGILMKTRFAELSLVQRMISLTLLDSIADQKIFDRLSATGLCLSYVQSLRVSDELAADSEKLIVKAVEEGKSFRLIGDNLNISVDVNEEFLGHHKHLEHMFASAALINERRFINLSDQPEIGLDALSYTNITLTSDEYRLVRDDCAVLVANILAEFLPEIAFIKDSVSKNRRSSDHASAQKTKVIPLPVLPLNEMYYDDDVKILSYYKNLVRRVYDEAKQDPEHIQIGGDQLTRERFSGAKDLRLRNPFQEERFDSLSPITFEFFHLMMNFMMKVIYKRLYSSSVDKGTLRHAQERLHRHSVDPDGMKSYEPNKDLFVSFFKAYLVAAAQSFFGIDGVGGRVTKNCPNAFNNDDERKKWVNDTLARFIDDYVFPVWSKSPTDESQRIASYVAVREQITVTQADGSVAHVLFANPEEVHAEQTPDQVKNYAHLVLELGMLFTYLTTIIKAPDRNRMLRAVKMLLPIMKGNNNKAKYALELLRLLVQQYSLLPQRSAFQVFHDCFVNTRGKKDSHVPSDQMMEWVVKADKKYLKHMCSNKSEKSIYTKTAAMPVIHDICEKYDKQSNVVVRSKRHTNVGAKLDEDILLTILSEVKPFQHRSGRHYHSMNKIPPSLSVLVDDEKLKNWFVHHKNLFTA